MRFNIGIVIFILVAVNISAQNWTLRTKDELLNENYSMSSLYSYDDEARLALNSREYYLKANEYRDRKDYNNALINYERALSMFNWGAYYYHYGYCFMDMGDYVSAEKAFRKAIQVIPYYSPYEIIAPYHNIRGRNPIYSFDNNGITRELYFSYYNLACIYSLTNKLSDSAANIILAIENGYPYLNHIFADTDLANLFNSPNSAQIRRDINRIYSLGAINNVSGKTFYYRPGPNDLVQYEFIDNTRVRKHYLTSDDRARVLHGTYTVTNHHVIIRYNRETGERGYGETYNMGVNTGYSNYAPYDNAINQMEYISLKEMAGEWGWGEERPW